MKCDLCPGEYRDKLTVIPLTRDGRTIVVADVPAHVCNLCGDRLYSGSTFDRLTEVLDGEPEGTVPIYRFQPASSARR